MNNHTDSLKTCAGITAITGAISLSVVALIALFAPQQLTVAAWIVASLCLMGTTLGYLATRKVAEKREMRSLLH